MSTSNELRPSKLSLNRTEVGPVSGTYTIAKGYWRQAAPQVINENQMNDVSPVPVILKIIRNYVSIVDMDYGKMKKILKIVRIIKLKMTVSKLLANEISFKRDFVAELKDTVQSKQSYWEIRGNKVLNLRFDRIVDYYSGTIRMKVIDICDEWVVHNEGLHSYIYRERPVVMRYTRNGGYYYHIINIMDHYKDGLAHVTYSVKLPSYEQLYKYYKNVKYTIKLK